MRKIDLDQQLSPHFTLREMVASATAIKYNIDNTPESEDVICLRTLCEKVLEPLRKRFGAIHVTSGFRSVELNEKVGGVRSSQHLQGQAADIYVPNAEVGRKMYLYVLRNLEFDQMFVERKRLDGSRWIHVSYVSPSRNRYEAHPHWVV